MKIKFKNGKWILSRLSISLLVILTIIWFVIPMNDERILSGWKKIIWPVFELLSASFIGVILRERFIKKYNECGSISKTIVLFFEEEAIFPILTGVFAITTTIIILLFLPLYKVNITLLQNPHAMLTPLPYEFSPAITDLFSGHNIEVNLDTSLKFPQPKLGLIKDENKDDTMWFELKKAIEKGQVFESIKRLEYDRSYIITIISDTLISINVSTRYLPPSIKIKFIEPIDTIFYNEGIASIMPHRPIRALIIDTTGVFEDYETAADGLTANLSLIIIPDGYSSSIENNNSTTLIQMKYKKVRITLHAAFYGGQAFDDEMIVFIDSKATDYTSNTPFYLTPGSYSIYLESVVATGHSVKYASAFNRNFEVFPGHPKDTTLIITEQ